VAAVTLRLSMLKADLYEDLGLVFAAGKGTPLDAQNIVTRHFKSLLRCGVAGHTLARSRTSPLPRST
jgi:hypothetical protein